MDYFVANKPLEFENPKYAFFSRWSKILNVTYLFGKVKSTWAQIRRYFFDFVFVEDFIGVQMFKYRKTCFDENQFGLPVCILRRKKNKHRKPAFTKNMERSLGKKWKMVKKNVKKVKHTTENDHDAGKLSSKQMRIKMMIIYI